MKHIRSCTRWNKILCAALSALLLLGGCAANDTETPSSAGQAAVAETQTPVTAEEYVPQQGGTMYISIPASVTDYDPLTATSEDMINALSLVYETPLTLASDGTFSPNLVESWEVDESGRVFTFHIRQGVTFHSGDTLDAGDFVHTINRIFEMGGRTIEPADGDDGAPDEPGGDNAAQPQDEEEPDTQQPLNRYAMYNDQVVGVLAANEYTLQVTMAEKGRSALYFMTFPVCSETGGLLNGSGPYVAAVDEETGSMNFTINKNWWRVSPYIETIIANPIENGNLKTGQYELGLYDLVTTDSIASSKHKEEDVTQVVDYLTNYYDCLVPNLFDESMKDDRVRQALSYAIDRREIIVTALLNHAVAAEIPLSPDFFAYDVKYKLYEHDAQRAMDLLSEAGYSTAERPNSNVLSIDLIVISEVGGEYRLEAARSIARQFTAVGVECNLIELSAADYMERLNNSNFTLAYVSYYTDENPDLTFMLGTGQKHNYGNIASAQLDEIMLRCKHAYTDDEIIEAYEELQQYFIEKVPQIGLYFRMNSIVADANLHGIGTVYQNHLFYNIHEWSIEK